MRCSLALATCVAIISNGDAQFLQHQDGDAHVVSSMSMSSFSMFVGRDGEMHQSSQQTQQQITKDAFGNVQTRSTKVGCKDGHCKEVGMIVDQPRPPCPMQRFRGILQRLMGPYGGRPGEFLAPRQRPTELIIEQMPQRGEIIIEEIPAGRPMQVVEIAGFHGQPEPQKLMATDIGSKMQSRQFQFMALGAGIFALISAYATIMAIMKFRASDARESARERPLRDLAQPLAEEPQDAVYLAANRQQMVHAPKVAAVPMYLSRLYAKANDRSESRMISEYMCRLYNRICA